TMLVSAGNRKVKVSFFAALGTGRVGKPDWTDDGVLQIASLKDLMATKLKVLSQRVEAKDYQDVAAMLGAGADLATALSAARKLYGDAFQPNECLKALVYVEGGDLSSLPASTRRTLIAAASSVRDLPNVRRLARTLSLAGAKPRRRATTPIKSTGARSIAAVRRRPMD
ncbi:MAG: nucleotidyl transferase AbiEii/AbiGii toxin family protein, partial [Dongiaceae bacterium]